MTGQRASCPVSHCGEGRIKTVEIFGLQYRLECKPERGVKPCGEGENAERLLDIRRALFNHNDRAAIAVFAL